MAELAVDDRVEDDGGGEGAAEQLDVQVEPQLRRGLVAVAAAVRSQRFKRALATGRSNDYDNNDVALMDDPSDV